VTAARLRLDDVNTLLVDGDAFQLNLLADMLRGLGLTRITLAETGAEAQDHFQQDSFDLCICESRLPDLGGAELVRWVRRLPPPARFVPLLVVTGYSEFRDVTSLRDAGAHLVMRKPAMPQALYDRIAWVAKPRRAFIETETYCGPDRRFKSLGPPGGVGRRATDLSAEIGDAVEPNMTQDEIDNLMRPTRICAE
jgi:CheY-like chemotaxis protein